MEKYFITILIAIILFFGISNFTEARVSSVRGYFRSNGTYVQSYYRTSPNKSSWDNWSTKGNYNPFTGKKGYVSPFRW